VEQLEQPARNPLHKDFFLRQAAQNLFQLFHSVFAGSPSHYEKLIIGAMPILLVVTVGQAPLDHRAGL
jgi:hypothetical protein